MSKKRLTITLSASTLDKIDRLVDNKQIRSRSHAIESLLQKSLSPQIKTAVILAGLENKQDEPRPLTKLNDRPLIFFTLELLAKHGIEQVLILTNDPDQQIEQTLNSKQYQPILNDLNLNINFIYEDQPLGTAGAIKHAQPQIGTNSFFCLHGDILTNIDLTLMAEFHQDHNSLATIALKPRMSQDYYDNVFLQGNKVVDFKPKKQGQTVSIVNTGVYLFEPNIFKFIPSDKPSTLEKDVFPNLASGQSVHGFTFQGIWFDITSDENYQQALTQINKLNQN